MSNCSANHYLNIWLGLFVVSSILIESFMLTYCLIFKVLTCLFQLLYFIKAVFLCQHFFKKFFRWLPIFRCILVYHLYPSSSTTFFKSFCCLFALVSRTSITIPTFIFIVNTFLYIFFKIFYMFFRYNFYPHFHNFIYILFSIL